MARGYRHAIEIVSEASRAVPPDIQARRPDVPWREIRNIGNVLRHAYHGVSDPILWRVVTDELPALREAVEALAAEAAAAGDEGAT